MNESDAAMLRRKELIQNSCIKIAMSLIGVLICCWCLRTLSIPLGSGLGIGVLLTVTILVTLMALTNNIIEFGVILFIFSVLVALLAQQVAEIRLKSERRQNETRQIPESQTR